MKKIIDWVKKVLAIDVEQPTIPVEPEIVEVKTPKKPNTKKPVVKTVKVEPKKTTKKVTPKPVVKTTVKKKK